MCGDQAETLGERDWLLGSSPRVRGPEWISASLSLTNRFIPACAGTRDGQKSQRAGETVHPRVCGDQQTDAYNALLNDGSSPRVRGPDLGEVFSRFSLRFIPACAGTSRNACPYPAPPAVHPRVCGDQGQEQKPSCWVFGSSPRVRGPVKRRENPTSNTRFIPACAGTSDWGGAPVCQCAVHPRVCGDQGSQDRLPFGRFGSSPRVRGPARRTKAHASCKRFIPACAGTRAT